MGNEDVAIQISSENNAGDTPITVAGNWIHKVNSQLQQLNQNLDIESERWKGESIYRIPWYVKKLRSSAYRPQTVSIGPYHHSKKSLKAMEKHKQRALLIFLQRKRKPLQCYVNALAQVVDDLMGAYDQLQLKWKSNKEAFLELMIVDGCFILELLQTAKFSSLKEMGYPTNDPVFSRHGHLYFAPLLRRDMLMLENQIPISVLNTILVVADGGDPTSKEEDLNALILQFFHPKHNNDDLGSSNCSRSQQKPVERKFGQCLHILDLYRKSLLLEHYSTKIRSRWSRCCGRSKQEGEPYTPSARELVEAGIRLERSKTTKLNDISFHSGVLKLPSIDVDDALESEYLNMMALERFHDGLGSEVTSFVFFMDRLIDSGDDVSILQWRCILQNSLGADAAVAKLFNSLSREACLDNRNTLYQVHEDVTKYYRSPLQRCMAYAKRNYFTNAWVGLSVAAAVCIFASTTVQAIYTVLQYHGPKDNTKPTTP